jgi:hypothetical protein
MATPCHMPMSHGGRKAYLGHRENAWGEGRGASLHRGTNHGVVGVAASNLRTTFIQKSLESLLRLLNTHRKLVTHLNFSAKAPIPIIYTLWVADPQPAIWSAGV